MIDVAIAGGGPGGLATAAAMIAAFGGNVRVKVRHALRHHVFIA